MKTNTCHYCDELFDKEYPEDLKTNMHELCYFHAKEGASEKMTNHTMMNIEELHRF